MKRFNLKKKLSLLVVFVAAISVLSCIAAIPIAVMYFKDKNQTKAEAEMPASAEKIYSTAVSMAEEKNLKILKKEDDNFYLEVTDGVQIASLKAKPESSEKTQVTVTATLPSEEDKDKDTDKDTDKDKEIRKEQEKELALRIINRICERLEVKCTINQQ